MKVASQDAAEANRLASALRLQTTNKQSLFAVAEGVANGGEPIVVAFPVGHWLPEKAIE